MVSTEAPVCLANIIKTKISINANTLVKSIKKDNAKTYGMVAIPKQFNSENKSPLV